MPPDVRARIIVLDTGPLITLAAAECLDYLLYPGLPVMLPDAVLYEATRNALAIGAAYILEWTQAHTEEVQTVSTEAFFNHIALSAMGRRERGLGERSAFEVLNDATHLRPGECALLLSEDDAALNAAVRRQGAGSFDIIPVTTSDFLHGLELAGRINSAAEVYARASDGGRFASRRSALRGQHEQALAAVQAAMKPSL